jgi:hypothetical protein
MEMRAYSAARNVFDRFRAWPKTYPDFGLWEARFLGISECYPTLAADDPFRPGRFIIITQPRDWPVGPGVSR